MKDKCACNVCKLRTSH